MIDELTEKVILEEELQTSGLVFYYPPAFPVFIDLSRYCPQNDAVHMYNDISEPYYT